MTAIGRFLTVLAAALTLLAHTPLVATSASAKTYVVNSLIIPMDTDFQDAGMLKAYGLVFKLLSNGVPVDWVILPGKNYGQADFTADFRNIKTASTGTHAYRGGPFVIDATSRAAALPIVQAWQTANPTTVVHEATAPFTANVGRSLVAAPRLAVLDDGNSAIAFGYLNAAAIPDSAGNVWSATSPDLLTPAAVAGATTSNHRDGALFDSNGVPLFSFFMSMHYATTGVNTEAVAETTEFLKSRTLLFAECQSVLAFENNARFLTAQGFTVSPRPTSVVANFSDQPVAQADGAFGTVGGSEPAFVPAGGYLGTEGTDYFRLVRGPSPTPTSDVVILGNALQNAAAGRVVYVGGHQYSTAVPISANPTTQGVRYFLNAILFAPATAVGDGLADLALTLNGPTSSMTAPNDYAVTYQNSGTGVCLGTQITVPIPAGMTASMISGGGAVSAGQIVWNLANLDAGKPAPAGTLGFRLTASGFGNYTVKATGSYKRGLTSATAESSVTTSYAADVTQPPTLTAPAADAVTKSPITVTFTLPEAALAESVKVNFGAHQLMLANSQETASQHTFSFNPADPTASAAIASGAAIPDGTYAVTLSYQDTAGNAPATAERTGVIVDTTAPVFDVSGYRMLRFTLGDPLLPFASIDISDATAVTLSAEPPLGSALGPIGMQTIRFIATDAAGNSSFADVQISVRPADPVSTPALATGDLAPGAGAAGGPPGDALMASFGVPAVDDAGNVAFLAKWTSLLGGKGSGLFTATECVAKIGGGAPGISGATFKTLSDPVIAGGRVGFLSTLAGVPATQGSAVWSGPPAAPALVAQAGTVAPDGGGVRPVGGAVFKSFKAVAVEGDSVAFLAQLSGGVDAAHVTGGTDFGLWLKDATHPLTLVLREGQTVGTRTIKTLIAFASGNGSPGQGRGWLTQSGSNGPRVLALATFTGTDKAQAVVGVGFSGGVGVLTQNNPSSTLPDIAGASFASYGLPTINADGKSAFLASLAGTPGGPATTANARGIFIDYGNPTYTKIVRLGEPAGATGGIFSVLKDPVLAEDASLAFPATIKGVTVKGIAAATLWTKTLFGPLRLFAQGGQRPGSDLPADAQWRTFASLAIAADRGPIFTATMVVGKGGVTATTATGVWAADFNGAPRLLFRTGDLIGGKTLKSFALLKATVGSLGVTRSFNDASEVVWLATFTDKSMAIIGTEVP